MAPCVRFGVFSDLHVDIMHDCEARLRAFLTDCAARDVDFIIQLGDFCYPDEGRRCLCRPENRPVNIQNALDAPTYADKAEILRLYRDFPRPSYHVIGNHDLDMCSHEQMMAFYGGIDSPYYSFDCGGCHFAVLDPNYVYADGRYIPYDNGIYFDYSYEKVKRLPYLPAEQIEWLRRDLADTPYPTVVFSHQRLCPGGLCNADALAPVLAGAPNRVILAANGHLHKDNLRRTGDTWFWNVNSMSCYWLDRDYAVRRYTPELDEKYPNIRYTVPYRDPLYAIVTVTDGVIDIRGRRSEFVCVSPAAQGFPMTDWEDVVSPGIGDYNISY